MVIYNKYRVLDESQNVVKLSVLLIKFLKKNLSPFKKKNNINTEDDFISGLGKNDHFSRRTPDNIDNKIHNTISIRFEQTNSYTYNLFFKVTIQSINA